MPNLYNAAGQLNNPILIFVNDTWVYKPINEVTYAELAAKDERGINGFYQPLIDCESKAFTCANYLFKKFRDQLQIEDIRQEINHPDFNVNYLLLALNALDWGTLGPWTSILQAFADRLTIDDFLLTPTKGAFEGKHGLWIACDAAAHGRIQALNFILGKFANSLKTDHFLAPSPRSGRDAGITALGCLRKSYNEDAAKMALQILVDFKLIEEIGLEQEPQAYDLENAITFSYRSTPNQIGINSLYIKNEEDQTALDQRRPKV